MTGFDSYLVASASGHMITILWAKSIFIINSSTYFIVHRAVLFLRRTRQLPREAPCVPIEYRQNGCGSGKHSLTLCLSATPVCKYFWLPSDAGCLGRTPGLIRLWYIFVFSYDRFTPDYLAGGSVQNSTRVAQWILKKPNVCSYFGCVGNDDFARILKDKAE